MHPTKTNHHQQMRVVVISSCNWEKGKEQQCMAGLLINNINALITYHALNYAGIIDLGQYRIDLLL